MKFFNCCFAGVVLFLLCLKGLLQLENMPVVLGMVEFNRFLGYLRVGPKTADSGLCDSLR